MRLAVFSALAIFAPALASAAGEPTFDVASDAMRKATRNRAIHASPGTGHAGFNLRAVGRRDQSPASLPSQPAEYPREVRAAPRAQPGMRGETIQH